MDDNNNKNQPGQTANDYQKILDEYAASIKPEATPDTAAPEEVKTVKLDEAKDTSDEKAFLKDINNPQLESPVHPSLAANLEVDDDYPKILSNEPEKISLVNPPKNDFVPPTPVPTSTQEPVKTPEQIKSEIEKILATDTTPSQPLNDAPKSSKLNIFKILFILSLITFFGVAGVLAYTLLLNPSTNDKKTDSDQPSTITPTSTVSNGSCELNGSIYQIGESFASADGCNTCSCQSADVITCTEKACSVTPEVIPATKSATVTSTTKTAFQKMIANFTLYKEITSEERLMFTKEGNYWPSFTKSTDKLYPFVQKLIKGSIKTLVIDHNNLKSILTSEDFKDGYPYPFYLTPNYEKWTSSEFKNLEYQDTGLGDFTPLYAYSDKLIWTTRTRNTCGGARPENIESQKTQDQCVSLVKEIETAFP